MTVPKQFLVEQLAARLRESAEVAERAEHEAREAASRSATENEKREDARTLQEFGSLATGQAVRLRKVHEELEALERFARKPLPSFQRQTPLGLGAVVDISTESDSRREERTYILLPVGAGTELNGPDGDGFLGVITPQSPVGRAILGKRVGDTFDVTVKGDVREWRIMDVA